MSRRGMIVTILVIGAALAVFFLRSNKEAADILSPAAEVSSPSEETTQNAVAKSAQNPRDSISSSTFETTSSSSNPAGPPPRGARSADRPLGGKKSYNTQGAKLVEDPAFAGTAWKIWSGVSAYPKTQGEPSGNRLGEVNGYFLVTEGQVNSAENFDPAKPLVVLRTDLNTAGVVTGMFAVVLEEGASADFLSQSSQLKLVSSFPNIQTYYVTSSEVPFSLKGLQEALREAPEVKEVKMEILDRQYEKF
ncbi:hypothetical protein AZI86_08445 [Bdellovibrio bacteriovorus]|uniref:ASP external chaperone domain-containing protein n=1 Tax=Bdellovibrio bacteriovorus TaxID=959 RepID=A0A150WS56_BDEBC|nr:hypothetical protein [Bdellovibrio bacteriovorus]KYG67035.1 hypothetical protein AZI86_08445 [Bdellovibrio bacteriovorus]